MHHVGLDRWDTSCHSRPKTRLGFCGSAHGTGMGTKEGTEVERGCCWRQPQRAPARPGQRGRLLQTGTQASMERPAPAQPQPPRPLAPPFRGAAAPAGLWFQSHLLPVAATLPPHASQRRGCPSLGGLSACHVCRAHLGCQSHLVEPDTPACGESPGILTSLT